MTNKGDHLPRGGGKRDVSQDLLILAVTEAHRFEAYLTCSRCQVFGAWAIPDLWRGIQQLKDTERGCKRALRLVIARAELLLAQGTAAVVATSPRATSTACLNSWMG